MKCKYVLFIATILFSAFAACKKDNQHAVTGKWQEVKTRVMQDSAGIIINDTTYAGNTFTNLDYAQFNADGVCVISSSHNYYPAAKGYPKTPPYDLTRDTLKVRSLGPAYVLSPLTVFINPGGFSAADTAEVQNQNNMIIHAVYYGPLGPYQISYSYYTK
jgi:hypothetical protein